MATISKADLLDALRYLNEADAEGDMLYENAALKKLKGHHLSGPAHRLASRLTCLRFILEEAAGMVHNSSRDLKSAPTDGTTKT